MMIPVLVFLLVIVIIIILVLVIFIVIIIIIIIMLLLENVTIKNIPITQLYNQRGPISQLMAVVSK
jgi:hypothetical protein